MATELDLGFENTDSSNENIKTDTLKKSKHTFQYRVNSNQYQAVRYVSFMTEDTKHEISVNDFLKEAIARNLEFYQTKRGIEFPNKMLAELTRLKLIG